MRTEYITRDGVHLRLGRVNRAQVDRFIADNPEPRPPKRPPRGAVFGGVSEDDWIEDKENPEYQTKLKTYWFEICNRQIDLIAEAVEFDGDYSKNLEAIYMLMSLPRSGYKADVLRYVILADTRDATEVARAIVYNSTVTLDGINEAYAMFGVEWAGMPAHSIKAEGSPARFNLIYESRRAANYNRIQWADFCKLSGPEQSEIVAFYRLEIKLQWLMNSNKK